MNGNLNSTCFNTNVLMVCFVVLCITSCNKKSAPDNKHLIRIDTGTVRVTTPPPQPPSEPPVIDSFKIITLGSGNGDLVIDGSNLQIDGKKIPLEKVDTIKIKGGAYSSIDLKNFSGTTDKRVVITNSGVVQLQGDFTSLDLENLNNVTISGGGSSGVSRGFQFLNNKFRSVKLRGSINNFTLEKMLFKNVSDYVIFYEGNVQRVYNGSQNSYSQNLAFLDLDAENVGQFIGIEGEIGSGSLTGLIKNVEVARITCINSPEVGAVVFLGNCENYNVHDNLVSNVNGNIDNHNGIFMLRGNGKFYRNTVKNHQGNALRSWLYSLNGANGSSVEVYDNVVYNSRKYSAFELQVPPYIKSSALFKPATAKVFNNTVGRMNTERSSFPGRLLDLYSTFSTLELYNNLLFDDNDDLFINNNSDTKITVDSKNFYFQNQSDAVDDLLKFISKTSGVGARP